MSTFVKYFLLLCLCFTFLYLSFNLRNLQFKPRSYKDKMDIADDSNEQSTSAAAEGVLLPRGTQTAQADLLAVNKVEDPMEKPSRPHIVFILADDLGWSDIGYHGNAVHTPFIDQLANTGVKLGNYYAQPNCSPSRASFLTGKYSDRNGIQHAFKDGQAACLPLYHRTLPEILKQNGYSTHLVGKWHLGHCREECLPYNRGFDTFFGMLGGSSNLFSHISHGNYDFWDHNKRAMKYKGVYSAEVYGEKAVEVIENHANSKKENPMFLFLSFQVPHEPQQVPPSYINKWKSYANVKPERRKKLFGQISCMDEVVNKVVNSLRHNHLWNNTVVIFSSDNGGPFRNEASNIPLRGQKRTHFEGGIRVVGFVNSPLLSDEVQGKTFNGLIGIADWFPTFIEGMAGGQTDRVDIDGINVWDSLRYGTPSPREDYVISVGEECLGAPVRNNTKYWDTIGIDPRTSIRSGPWKLIVQQDDTEPSTKPADVLLFNVDLDITESTNLAEENEDVVRRLRQRVKEYCSKTVPIVSFKTKHFPKSSNDNQKGCQLEEKYIRRGKQ